MAKEIPCQGKQREFGNFAKTQGIWFARVVNSLILKVKNISLFAAEIFKFVQSWISLPSQFCVYNSHKSHKLAQGKFAVGKAKKLEKHGKFENENLSEYPAVIPTAPHSLTGNRGEYLRVVGILEMV